MTRKISKTRARNIGAVSHHATTFEGFRPAPSAYQNLNANNGVTTQCSVVADNQPRTIDGPNKIGETAVEFDVTSPKTSFADAKCLMGFNERIET